MVEPKNLATVKEEQLAALPMSLDDLSKDAALGGEMGIKDIAIPYLYILQQLSPQVVEDHPKYVTGAKPGFLYLSGLEKATEGREKGLLIVPCHYERLFTEWVPRDKGGGFCGSHAPDSAVVQGAKVGEKGNLVLPNGNILTETAYHYVLAQIPGTDTWYQAIMPMKSTALKVSRKMNSALSVLKVPGADAKAPRFLYTWRMTTVKEQKDDMIWSSPKIEIADMVTREIYKSAKDYAVIASQGMLRRDAIEAGMEEDVGPSKASGGNALGADGLPF